MVNESAALLCLDPQTSKILNGRGFAQHPRDHLSPILVDRNRHVTPVSSLEDVAPLRCNADWLAATNFWERQRLCLSPTSVISTFFATTRFLYTRLRRLTNEGCAEQSGDTGVVVEPELIFLGFFMDAGAATNHLIERDRRFQVPEEHHRVQPLDIHAGRQEVHGAGDEAAFARAAHLLDEVCAPFSGAFEGIMPFRGDALLLTPRGVEPLHLHLHSIGMEIASAEDDDLLFRAAMLTQAMEQILAHRRNSFRKNERAIECFGGVLLIQVLFSYR